MPAVETAKDPRLSGHESALRRDMEELDGNMDMEEFEQALESAYQDILLVDDDSSLDDDTSEGQDDNLATLFSDLRENVGESQYQESISGMVEAISSGNMRDEEQEEPQQQVTSDENGRVLLDSVWRAVVKPPKDLASKPTRETGLTEYLKTNPLEKLRAEQDRINTRRQRAAAFDVLQQDFVVSMENLELNPIPLGELESYQQAYHDLCENADEDSSSSSESL
jgi:hypothetical protein